jgi:hypothetical protein
LHRKTPFLCLMSAAFVIMWLAACQPGVEKTPEDLASQQVPSKEGSPTGAPQSTVNSTEIASASIQFIWEVSPHANTYVLDALGMNSTCAVCHAPLDFVPSMDNMPESCATCKFTVPDPPPTIAKTDWRNIPCTICHQMKKGKIDPQYAWLAIPPIDEYEDVATTTDLCNKCHADANVAGHTPVDVAGAHAGYTCTQCHDAHSTTASCSTGSCHADVLDPSTPIPGHDQDHKEVACWACHDGAGMAVGPNAEGKWLTLQSALSDPFASHNIVKEALCERCHFLNNPWQLSPDVSK